ncbi:MAG TPA: PHP domain-containing protein [Chloroflexota bacterium]|nr:PHP domain-containing protein [Chloroflexota bacterium]
MPAKGPGVGVDLHLHTLASDGRLTAAELVRLAHARGVRRLAITDHDTTDAVAAAAAEGLRLGVDVIPGIELGTDIPGSEVHMLGYFLRYQDDAFQAVLAGFRDGRIGRARGMVAHLNGLGLQISWERVREIAAEASVGRPHVAQALLEAGYVQSMPEAFEKYIGRNGPAYVERVKFTPIQAIELIHSVSGLAVVAHPVLEDGELDVTPLLPELAAAGLDGLECYYQGYDPALVQSLVGLARQHGLVPTGGSDYHGFPLSGQTEVVNFPGSVDVPPTVVDELEGRLARR